jgi:hypothetical protein
MPKQSNGAFIRYCQLNEVFLEKSEMLRLPEWDIQQMAELYVSAPLATFEEIGEGLLIYLRLTWNSSEGYAERNNFCGN